MRPDSLSAAESQASLDGTKLGPGQKWTRTEKRVVLMSGAGVSADVGE